MSPRRTTTTTGIRRVTLAAAAAASLCLGVTGAGAGLDPRALVLHRADVPPGFIPNRHDTHYVPNDWAKTPKDKTLFEKTGRVGGYVAGYDHRAGARLLGILSESQVMRTRAGAAMWLAHDDAQERAFNKQRIGSTGGPYRRQALTLGDDGWTYWQASPRFTLVEWRVGSTVGTLLTWGLTHAASVRLARKQLANMRAALK